MLVVWWVECEQDKNKAANLGIQAMGAFKNNFTSISSEWQGSHRPQSKEELRENACRSLARLVVGSNLICLP
jgi:hypothetical protein